MSRSIRYYDSHATQFAEGTLGVDMSDLHRRFLTYVPANGLILDAGCGAGRDSKAFLQAGFRVRAFDASAELVRLAQAHSGHPVELRRFEDVEERSCYDGIWACASLLHVPEADLPVILARVWAGLKPGGVFYLSFKHGEGERSAGGRDFTDATEARLREWVSRLPEVEALECWITRDQRPERSEQWLNGLLRRKTVPTRRLFTGEPQHPLLSQLCHSIARADEIDLAVSFVQASGLRLLLPDLHDALARHAVESRPPARVRILTSDYLDITDPNALRLLMLLQEQGAQVRIFESGGRSFHLKAYLFAHFPDASALHGTVFIGSSNISRPALTDGLEWNYRVDYPGDDGFLEARARFEELFRDPRTVELTDAWIERYEARRVPPPRPIEPSADETEQPPTPTPIQQDALAALAHTRCEGYLRGLVVLATGLGKTWLAAFDAQQIGARRVLFVAHREEILNQAADTFVCIRPRARVGFYMGQIRDTQVDVLCASVQTLGRNAHLERFSPQHFDYIVVDEFHHAAAPTYRRLLAHFAPQFLLGLTATPDRTDQSDILSLCDDNLVFDRNLFAGIEARLLAPFYYYGVWDASVDYKEIPWRNGRFDPDKLSNKLATLARARHALKEWRKRAQRRTLAFCVSIRHAEFMATQFRSQGIDAAAVYAGSELARGEALEQLADGRLAVIFSVDLFNEGVDLPTIDTVLMLRPTESKILFLQQLGRGLRIAEGKERLVVLDFIGNHHSFLHKPQALGQIGSGYKRLADFARKVETRRLELPAGCYINFDLELIDFLKSLNGDGIAREYEALRDGLGRRPTLAEFYRSGANLGRMRKEYESWFGLVKALDDLGEAESVVLDAHAGFLREIETTAMNKSFKMVLLEAFQELDGWRASPSLGQVAERSWKILQRRRPLLADLPETLDDTEEGTSKGWQRYWRDNPVNAWIGGNQPTKGSVFFRVQGKTFEPSFPVIPERRETLTAMAQELIDYRLAGYEARRAATTGTDNVVPFVRPRPVGVELPYFPNLRIACGHFRTSRADAEEHRRIGSGHGRLDPARHFIARASGSSMNGGKHPIRDGDYLLLELVSPTNAGSITGSIMAIERQDQTGEDQYLLRVVTKQRDGSYVLVANNSDYEDIHVTPEMAEELRTLARLKAVVDPLELVVGESFMREEIPALFGEEYNPGNWNVGHVVLPERKAHVLLVTLNKQGKAEEHRYLDRWVDERTFEWSTQNATTPDSKKGRELIGHEKLGITLHLFVRETKLAGGKAAPFLYCGTARYKTHKGSAPMSVVLDVG